MNVNDYVNYYKNISFDDYKWNDVDNLVCAAFAYLPLGRREIDGLFLPNKVLKKSNHPAAGLLFEVLDSIRYKGLELWDYVNIVNELNQTILSFCTAPSGSCRPHTPCCEWRS